MPAGFYKLTVANVKRETKDAVSIEFEIPEDLRQTFAYTAGQYLTFSIIIDGGEVRRSYSVCSNPITDVYPTIAVKQVEKGLVSTYLNTQISAGDSIEVMPPMGKFTVAPNAANANTYFLFGGGSGITPLFSILKTVLMEEPNSKCYLFYANRDEPSVIFKNELDEIAQSNPDRFKLIYSYDEPSDNWSGHSGYLTADKVSEIIRSELGLNYPISQYFTCGPGPMMDVVVSGLKTAGVAEDRIHTEYFTAAPKSEEEAASEETEVVDEEIKEREMSVECFGQTKNISVQPHETILIAAQEAGLDPPYSCTVGVCTTCRAKVRSGKVHMDEREGLSDAEIDQGYVLTCQAHPLTDNVDVVYE